MLGKSALSSLPSVTHVLLFAAVSIVVPLAQAQTETILHSFCTVGACADGNSPHTGLTSDGAGNLYGATTYGGLWQDGVAFELSPDGSGGWNETVLYNFCSAANCADGAYPSSSLLFFDSFGNLYGTTVAGGAFEHGIVFELSPGGASWTETVLHSFAGPPDGSQPGGILLMDAAGNLYGKTSFGGDQGLGSVFEMSPGAGGWTEQVIYNTPAYDDTSGGLAMDANGNIFSVTTSTAFELSPDGKGGWDASVLRTFIPRTGTSATGTVVLDGAGNLYGTTGSGGAHDNGAVYKLSPTGGRRWKQTILHAFKGGTDGSDPVGGIVLDAAGNIYGTTFTGGQSGDGTIFQLQPISKGHYKYKVLLSFDNTDGQNPLAPLTLDEAGNLYGTTELGGATLWGVAFEITP